MSSNRTPRQRAREKSRESTNVSIHDDGAKTDQRVSITAPFVITPTGEAYAITNNTARSLAREALKTDDIALAYTFEYQQTSPARMGWVFVRENSKAVPNFFKTEVGRKPKGHYVSGAVDT